VYEEKYHSKQQSQISKQIPIMTESLLKNISQMQAAIYFRQKIAIIHDRGRGSL